MNFVALIEDDTAVRERLFGILLRMGFARERIHCAASLAEWEQADVNQPTGLMMEYLSLAGEVWINGTLVSRDVSLVEPLSRAWNTPHYWPLAPLLRAGRNTMLVRVSGLGAYLSDLWSLPARCRRSMGASGSYGWRASSSTWG